MGSCEISEVREDLDYVPRSGKGLDGGVKEGKLPVLRLGARDSLEDDINQLFESFNLRNSSKHASPSHQAAASPLGKNALKKPITVGVSRSPRIGSSEPVTLKQALRDLCLSKASEMAANRRLSKSINSPRISEAGRIKNLYDKKIVDGNESVPKGGMLEISLVPQESCKSTARVSPVGVTEDVVNEVIAPSTNPGSKSLQPEIVQKDKELPVAPPLSNSFEDRVKNPQKQEMKTFAHSPRSLAAKLTEIDPTEDESIPASSQVVVQTLKELVEQPENIPTSTSLSSGDDVSEVHNNVSSSNKLGSKSAIPKPGRRVRPQNLHARVVTARGIRNKAIIKKKVKQDLISAASCPEELVNAVGRDPSSNQLVCKKCLCSLQSGGLDANNQTLLPSPITNPTAEAILTNMKNVKSGPDRPDTVVKPIGGSNARSRDKGEFSQSSKSSVGDYSSSTASLSDESNLSRSSCSNRPHMSKDVRWEAIRHVRRQRGVLGLNHFNLLKKLGSGDIGTVYLAELIGTSCLFAIKVMDNEFLARRKKMPRAQTEREIMRMLDHPFLPTLYSQFTSENLSCLVMEYCPGGDLHVLRQKQPGRHFVEPAARFYVAEVLLALEYLHMLGVVYRDLKPENILVREDGHIMLTDFDLSLRCTVSPTLLQSSQLLEPARISGPCTGSNCAEPFCMAHSCRVACFGPRILPKNGGKPKPDPLGPKSLPQLVAEPTDARSNSFVGTHEYLAPEIIKGEGHGAAVDWWTFGIFLYELLYGKTPFKGSGNEETLANVVLQSLRFPDSPSNVSFEAQDLIRGLLVKDPDHRLGTQKGAAEIKQHPFFEGLNWALIRCAIPPELPESYDFGVRYMEAPQEVESEYLEFKASGEQLEFELF